MVEVGHVRRREKEGSGGLPMLPEMTDPRKGWAAERGERRRCAIHGQDLIRRFPQIGRGREWVSSGLHRVGLVPMGGCRGQ